MSGDPIRNRLVGELSEATGENAAKCSEAIRGYYDLRLKYLKESPSLVAAYDAEELERAVQRAEEAGS